MSTVASSQARVNRQHSALKYRVLGGVKLDLFSEVFTPENLDNAYTGVLRAMKESKNAPRRSKKDHAAKIHRYERDRAQILESIGGGRQIDGDFRFRRFITKIPKTPHGVPERPISLFTFEERVILRSMLAVVWPYLEKTIDPTVSFCTFRQNGLHPARGTLQAVQEVSAERRRSQPFVFETDIHGFFDSIERTKLLDQVARLVPDAQLTQLILALLNAEVRLDDRMSWADEFSDVLGVPQGSALSPLLACTYLSPFDHFVKGAGFRMIRYVDDLVIFCESKAECVQVEEWVRNTLQVEYKLKLSERKTSHVQPGEALEFLGHTIFPDGRLMPGAKRVQRVRKQIFTLVDELPARGDREVVDLLSSYLLGFFTTMSHCSFSDRDYQNWASLVGNALQRRGLQRNRLSRQLRKYSPKWPGAFLNALP